MTFLAFFPIGQMSTFKINVHVPIRPNYQCHLTVSTLKFFDLKPLPI
jgi:hypothetical protein